MNEQLDTKRGNPAYAPPVAEREDQLPNPGQAARAAGYRRQTALVWVVAALFGIYALAKGVGAISDVLMATTGSNPAFGDATRALGLSYVTRDLILLSVNLVDATSCLLTIQLARALDARQSRRAFELWGSRDAQRDGA